MKCPECNKNLGKGSSVDLNSIGWVCNECGIKVYKEIYETKG